MISPTRRESAPFQRALILANPIAGNGRGARLAQELARALAARGTACDVFHTRGRGDAAQRVRALETGIDLVVSVGGDGTLREVFEGLEGRDLPVAVLPLGTANVLSLDLELPRQVERCVEVIAGGALQSIDLAQVNGKLSFLVTGVGLDAHTVRELERTRRGPIGKASYVPALLRALRQYREPRLEVEIDGSAVAGRFGLVLISNIVHYGGVMRLCRERRFDDGRFEVYLFPRGNVPSLLRAAWWGSVRGLPHGNLCSVRSAAKVRVSAPEPVPYQVDGDFGGETPVELVVTGARARVLVPAKTARRLP